MGSKQQRLVMRTRERYAAVEHLMSQGMSFVGIGRTLDRRTVRRFARATEVEELLTVTPSRASPLDEFKPYLHDRFGNGCTDATRLTREIAEFGSRGSNKTVRCSLQPLRDAHDALPRRQSRPRFRRSPVDEPADRTGSPTTSVDMLLGHGSACPQPRVRVRRDHD
ncbi:MAG: hypothetical protein EOP24_26995 [Hyphomicrobiales bacterium]|nr:MAG: hypothetical protein EOP24_26995 [Hyphomicrobiales bacterium]